MSKKDPNVCCTPADNRFRIKDIIKNGGYYDISGTWNSILEINNKLYRGRVETLIVDEDNNVYLNMYNNGTYRIPGGSFEKGVFNINQAETEALEEAKIKCKNVHYTGIHYIKNYDKQFKQEPDKVHWCGTYNEVYLGEFDNYYNGSIKQKDSDIDMATNGKFYPINEVWDKLSKPHKEALHDIKEKLDEEIKYNTQSIADLYGLNEEVEQEDDNFFHLTSVMEDTIIGIEKNTEGKYYPYFTPEQMQQLGVFREEGNYYSDNAVIDNYTKDWYNKYLNSKDGSVSADWYNKLKYEYDKYINNPNAEQKQNILNLGWNPEIPVNMDNIKKVADLREKEKEPKEVIDLQENYIFSKKDDVYNFDKWENGEYNILFITGHSGSGKSTLAYQLAKEYGATVISLDHIQCYERFCKANKETYTTKLIRKYLKGNKDLKVSDFNNILVKSFKGIYADMFPWLIQELEKDKNTLYIVEGIHIMLFTKYEDIKDYPLICINTSASKSILRHWIRDQFTIKELIKYGMTDIRLFTGFEDQYNSFKNSIKEEYVLQNDINIINEYYMYNIPVNPRKLTDEDYVRKLCNDIKNVNKSTMDKNVLINTKNLLGLLKTISSITIIIPPLYNIINNIIDSLIQYSSRNDPTLDNLEKYIDKIIDKTESQKRKCKDDKEVLIYDERIKKLNQSKVYVHTYQSIKNILSKYNKYKYIGDSVVIKNEFTVASLVGSFTESNNTVSNIEFISKVINGWRSKDYSYKDLIYDDFIEEFAFSNMNISKFEKFIKVNEGNATKDVKESLEDCDNDSFIKAMKGKTFTWVYSSDSDDIYYCSDDNLLYSLSFKYEDEPIQYAKPSELLEASKYLYDELMKIVDTLKSINESYECLDDFDIEYLQEFV